MKRRRLFTAIAGAAVASSVAGIAYATIPGPGNVYSACMLKGVGTIRLIDKSLPSTNLMSHCTDKETEISWNQAGQPGPTGPQGPKGESGTPGTNGTNGTDGKDGANVTTASEPAGANCADGGVQLTAANGVSYVCNGKAGADGKNGANGTNGTDGKDGVSVTSAVEPAGVNCTNGGSKFTAAGAVTYACNGAPGTSGISSLTDLNGLACNVGFATGTVQVLVDPTSGDVLVRCVSTAGAPGRLTVTVKAHCILNTLGLCSSSTTTQAEAVAAGFPTEVCEVNSGTAGTSVPSNTCSYVYPSGTHVDLVPHGSGTPSWSGACAGATSTCTLTLTSDSAAELDYIH